MKNQIGTDSKEDISDIDKLNTYLSDENRRNNIINDVIKNTNLKDLIVLLLLKKYLENINTLNKLRYTGRFDYLNKNKKTEYKESEEKSYKKGDDL